MTKRRKKKSERPAHREETISPQISSNKRYFFLRRPWIVIPVLLLPVFVLILLFVSRSDVIGGVRGAFKDHNVLLITVDTLRADHLPAYGYSGVKTPNIDRIAAESLIFQDAIAEVPLTLPSHTSILTGLLPLSHGVRDNATYKLDRNVTTLAEVLKSKGYTTAAFVSSAVLDSRYQLDQGFDFYFDNFEESGIEATPGAGVERRADDTELELEEWLAENQRKKTFAWIHFYDPHDPYKPPPAYASQYRTQPYDGEIAYTDEVIGKLMSRLDDLDLLSKTIVILTADHGESLGEHGESTHGVFVYDNTVKVPLIIKLPNGSLKSIPELVRHIDIAPTVLDWLGVDAARSMQGKTLLPLLRGKEKQKRIAYSESKFAELHYGWSPLHSITTSDYKYIDAPKPELYSRKADSRQRKNILKDNGNVAKQLKAELDNLRKNDSGAATKAADVDPETEEKLRALGYVATSVQATSESRKIDPKDKIHLHRYLSEAYAAMSERNYMVAIEKLRPLINKDSTIQHFNVVEAQYVAGIAYANLQKYPEAIEQLRAVVLSQPDHIQAQYNLANAYQVIGDHSAAEKFYKLVLDSDKDYLPAAVGLAKLYHTMNRTKEANVYFQKATSAYQRSLTLTKGAAARSRIYASLAEVHFSSQKFPEAEKNLRAAIELTPKEPNLHYNLAQMYEAMGEPLNAVEEYKTEISLNPSHYMALANLGLLYRQSQQFDKAIEVLRQVLRIIPGDLQASYTLAETELMANRNLEEARMLTRHVLQQKPRFGPAQKLLAAIEARIAQSK